MEIWDTTQALKFLKRQLRAWPMAAKNFKALDCLQQRTVEVNGMPFRLQHNPARIASTGASTDAAAIKKRPCFLCAENRPAEQLSANILPDYELLVNPFPIFKEHFTIPAIKHGIQMLNVAVPDSRFPQGNTYMMVYRFFHMLEIAEKLSEMAVFYNGAQCGASAPDHFHFQAVMRSEMPLLQWLADGKEPPFTVYYARFNTANEAFAFFKDLTHALNNGDYLEPKMNVIVSCSKPANSKESTYEDIFEVLVIPRKAHRPDFYGTEPGQMLLSPACVDLCGTIIVPRPDDFNNITSNLIENLINQTCFTG